MRPYRFLMLVALFVCALAPVAHAQAQLEADRILVKFRQLDLLNQLIPVLMTPEQLQKLLPPIEKARQATRDLDKQELADMKKVEPRIDAAIKDAKDKKQVPSREFLAEVILMLQGFARNRAAMVSTQNELVLKAVEETLDEGQIKAAANALAVPAGDTTKLSDRDKLKRWVRVVLMDPLSYDILVELSKKK